MANKWVDNHDYFGPDRRRRPAGKRWGERRQLDETSQLPPLGALLRRLRVKLVDLQTPDDNRAALQLIAAAIAEANRQGMRQCASELMHADTLLRQHGPAAAAQADAHITEAMNHAGARR